MSDFVAFLVLMLLLLAWADTAPQECRDRGGVPGYGVCFDPKVLK